jgi:hypothetical protein
MPPKIGLRSARYDVHRAYMFTSAITKDLVAADEAGLAPIILTVGLDGWACDRRMVLPYLNCVLGFEIVMRETELTYGLIPANFQIDRGIFWGYYDTKSLTKFLEGKAGDDQQYAELVEAWRRLQWLQHDQEGQEHSH